MMVTMSLPNHSQAGEKGLAAFESMTNNRENKRKVIPVITQSFASTSLGAGDTWKVYLNASDPDGDMKYIVCTIDQPGIGIYPVSFTRVKLRVMEEPPPFWPSAAPPRRVREETGRPGREGESLGSTRR